MRQVYSVQQGADGKWCVATGGVNRGNLTIHEAGREAERRNGQPAKTTAEAPADFDKGFGIGGLGRHIEDLPIPSVGAIKRMERIENEMEICRKCGESDLIDGAMFTTMAGSGYCDDCC